MYLCNSHLFLKKHCFHLFKINIFWCFYRRCLISEKFMTLGETNADWTSTPGRSYNANTCGKRKPKTLPRSYTVRIIHIGIESGCRKTRSKRADERAKITACRTRKNERKRERFKVESNLRKSWQHAESVILWLARQCFILVFFPFESPREHRSGALVRVQFGLACSRNDHVGWSQISEIEDHRGRAGMQSALKRSAKNNDFSSRRYNCDTSRKDSLRKITSRKPTAIYRRRYRVLLFSWGKTKLITVRIARGRTRWLIDRRGAEPVGEGTNDGRHQCFPTCRSISYLPSPP